MRKMFLIAFMSFFAFTGVLVVNDRVSVKEEVTVSENDEHYGPIRNLLKKLRIRKNRD